VPPRTASRLRREDGTASVELTAAIPFLLLAVLVAAQLGAVGYALWSAGIAARAGARAALVGGDGAATARRALPSALRSGAGVSDGEAVKVRVKVPRTLPFLPEVSVAARTELGSGGG